MKTLLAIAVFLVCLHSYAGLKCMSCTYTFAGAHGTYDRECVSAVRNFTKTRVIECEYFCMTKAVYVTGYSRLNSLYRGCGYKRERYCDNPRGLIPTCELSCTREDECNDGNGDLWKRMKPHPHPHPNPGGGGTSSSSVSSLVIVMGVAVHVVIVNKLALPTWR